MENATLVVGPAFVGAQSRRTRVTAIVAAVLLVLGMFVLVQHVDASPAGAAVAASVAASAAVGVDNAQINFNQLFCSILISVRNALASSPFGGFVTPILNSIIRGFGCAPS